MIGKSSSKPCVVCGQHKGNIVEPVSILTKCLDHRNYFTKPEKIRKVLVDYLANQPDVEHHYTHDDGTLHFDGFIDLTELAQKVDKGLK